MLIAGGGLPIVPPVALVSVTLFRVGRVLLRRATLKVARRVVMRALHTRRLCILICRSLMRFGNLMIEKALVACLAVANPSIIECATACTVTVVHELSLPPLQLSADDGAVIASAILAIWAIGWGFRALIQTLKHTDGNSTTEEN
jgi:hypothetical protein